jgi:two-component system response regulator AtoC
MTGNNSHNRNSRADQSVLPPDDIVFGCTPTMLAIRRQLEKVCGANIPILIQGEGGSGKETLARFIHSRSSWSEGQFVKVNCAAIPGALLESELFGYEKGAFTDANDSKPGRVEMAHRGTLFLDEIGDLGTELQVKLLQLLQDGRFTRLGDHEERQVEARIVCTTKRDLQQQVEQRLFRADLYYRINVISIHMPCLSDRREDVLQLADYYLKHFNAKFQQTAPGFPPEVNRVLQTYMWPGNIRELGNWVARYVLLGPKGVLTTESAGRQPYGGVRHAAVGRAIPLKRIAKDATLRMEREVILEVLQANHWNRRRAAQALKISYRALIYKMGEAGLRQKTRKRACP